MHLPAVGPAWFGMLMGTSILASATYAHGLPAVAWPVLALAWVVAAVLLGGFGWRLARRPHELAEDLAPAALSSWGMLGMGVMALGQATGLIIDHRWAWWVDFACWVGGTAVGFGFLALIAINFRRMQPPVFAHGLVPVTPMVSAAAAAGLAEHTVFPAFMGVVAVICFIVAAGVALPLFAVVYTRTLPGFPPVGASCTAFIPLGVCGQSTFAAQHISAVHDAWHGPALVWGTVMLTLAVVLGTYAYVTVARGLRHKIGFHPNWWGLTFPVGTCVMGSHQLTQVTGAAGWEVYSVIALVLLAANWLFAAGATGRALCTLG